MDIRVINHNAETLRGRYDGKDYVFAPGKPVTIDLEAGRHIFGLGEDDKAPALNKLGLLIPGRHTIEDALKKLDQISFEEGRIVFGADEESEEKPRGKRTGGRPHVLVPGGATEGGSQESPSANP